MTRQLTAQEGQKVFAVIEALDDLAAELSEGNFSLALSAVSSLQTQMLYQLAHVPGMFEKMQETALQMAIRYEAMSKVETPAQLREVLIMLADGVVKDGQPVPTKTV